MDFLEQWRARREEAEREIKQRTKQLSEGLDAIEARGRSMANEALRKGQKVIARTPSEIRQLGMMAKSAPAGVRKAVLEPARRVIAEAKTPAGRARLIEKGGHEVRAAVSGAVDEASFGLADPVLSGIESVVDGGFDSGLSDRFAANQERRKAEDEYDARHYGAARAVGQVVGIAGTVAETGLAGMALKAAGKRLAPEVFVRAAKGADKITRAAKMTPGGLTGLSAAGGAASGLGGQAVNDALSGKLSDPGDYAAAAFGGAVDGLIQRIPGAGRVAKRAPNGRFLPISDGEKMTRRIVDVVRSPLTAGGAGAATTSAAQDVVGGRDLDAVDIARSARGGIWGAQVGDVVGKFGAHALPEEVKERFGEGLSTLKSFASGEGSPWGKVVDNIDTLMPTVARGNTPTGAGEQRWVQLPSGRFTKVDRVTNEGFAVESKMGASARPTPNQREARRKLDRYRIDHWLPSDIGRAIAIPAASLGDQFSDDDWD